MSVRSTFGSSVFADFAPRFRPGRGHLVPARRGRRLRAGAPRNRPAPPGSDAGWKRCSHEHREHEKKPAEHADDGAEARGRHQERTPNRKRSASSAKPKDDPTCLLEKTQARLEDIQREIDGLKLKRKRSRPRSRRRFRRCATRWSTSASRKRASAKSASSSTARATRKRRTAARETKRRKTG